MKLSKQKLKDLLVGPGYVSRTDFAHATREAKEKKKDLTDSFIITSLYVSTCAFVKSRFPLIYSDKKIQAVTACPILIQYPPHLILSLFSAFPQL